MIKQKIFLASFLVLVFVAITNFIGVQYNLYTTYIWYDIPMHILGGLWVSLFFLSFYGYMYADTSIPHYNKKLFYYVFLVLLCVTISWEIFELTIKSALLSDGADYWSDTVQDIINGFGGGFFGYLFFIKNK